MCVLATRVQTDCCLLWKLAFSYYPQEQRFFLSPSIGKVGILMFQISCIENLNHLSELRVLNLAGNQITTVDNLTGIDALAELNLRRNKIRTVVSRSRL